MAAGGVPLPPGMGQYGGTSPIGDPLSVLSPLGLDAGRRLRTVKDAEAFTKKLYDEEQVIVLPGKYLGAEDNGQNPAEQYLRIALVHDIESTTKALTSIKKVLDNE